MKQLSLFLICLCLSHIALAEELTRWAKTLQKVSASVVTIRVDAARSFDTAAASSSQATGFVVDAERGYILTNRHVVQSGPVTAEALFEDKEVVELIPVYRDPVHDFGFFKYDPSRLKFIKPKALRLRPDRARVGRDIRVVGNDAGEELSILAGTLARLDREAPYYGVARYNDFNTFYYQSASGVSGGSSGSPVIDINGDVLALNAGGNRNASSSFFLTLYRVKRALKLLQNVQPVTRGTLQTTFSYETYDTARRLGLQENTEAELRRVNNGVGILVVKHTLPQGPADGLLFPGDILLKGGMTQDSMKWMRRFEELESLLDGHVDDTLHMLVERNGERVNVELAIQDLHSITPDRYLSFGGAVVHNLSYHQARHLNRPIEGVYIAQSGYIFSRSGVPRGAVILSVNNEPVKDISQLKEILAGMGDGDEAVVRYITFQESRRLHVSVISMDRRWFPLEDCHRDDQQGIWPCESLEANTSRVQNKPTRVSFETYSDPRAEKLASSMVYVQFDMPYQINGVQETYYGGSGLVIDADEGLVLVDRNTVPVAMGDVRVIFAGALDIPGQVVFVHPLHNIAIIKYDPALLDGTPVKSATLSDRKLNSGDKIWLVGMRSDQRLQVDETRVASIDPLEFSIPSVPSFREHNLDVISLHNAPATHGGVLVDEDGAVLAQWASFSYGTGGEAKQFEWGIPIELTKELLEQWHCCKQFHVYSLEVELAALSIAQSRKLGLDDEWFKTMQDKQGRRQVLAVARIAAGSDAAQKLQEGDLILAVDDVVVSEFRELEKLAQKDSVELTLLRSGKVIKLNVKTRLLTGRNTDRLLQWNGALIQNPHRALALQRNIDTTGVYVSFVWFGSPANRYDLNAVNRIIEFDGKPVNDLQQFIDYARASRDQKYVQIKISNLKNRESVISIRQNPRYWPTREIFWLDGEWISREVK